jgi:signal transduction histidine kinase
MTPLRTQAAAKPLTGAIGPMITSPSSLFEGLLRWLPTALLLVDPDGKMLHLNERGAAVLQVTDQAASLSHLNELPACLEPLKALFNHSATGGEDQIRQEVSLTFAPGQEARTIGYTLRHEQLPGVGPVRALVFSDITDILKEKAAAEQIKAELSQSKKMAAMGNLIAGVAHELNNPLIAIHMSADLTRRSVDRLLDESQTGLNQLSAKDWLLTVQSALSRTMDEVERVQGANQQATALVSDLLNYSRPGRLELELVDMASFIQKLLDQWHDTILAPANPALPRVAVTLVQPAIAPLLEVDVVKMEQVFFHLVRNAVEACANQANSQLTIAFKVLFDGDDAKKSRLLITLTDTGVGMSGELLERAFEPFFTTKGRQSTGMGLGQAYMTVERHGGHLSLSSQPGVGTTATVSLPYPDARAAEASPSV